MISTGGYLPFEQGKNHHPELLELLHWLICCKDFLPDGSLSNLKFDADNLNDT